MRFAPFVLALSLAAPVAAQSVIGVPGDAPTIQAGIDLAVDGDTVLVAPGTYAESISFSGKAITVRSVGGAGVTVVDASGTFEPTVVFHAGEGPSSVLRGFTVTGGAHSIFAFPGAGISCEDFSLALPASPRIVACVIEGNRNMAGGQGGGVGGGSPVLEDCVIRNNESIYDGGGVWGAASLLRCEVSGNSARDGGGLYLWRGTSALIEDCHIRGNLIQEGTRGAGIHVAMPGVEIRRTEISGNIDIGFSGMVQVQGSGVHAVTGAVPLLERCTVVGNTVEQGSAFGPDVGGIFGEVQLLNSIVWGNDDIEIDAAATVATYCDVEGGWPGTGNLNANPLFVGIGGDIGLDALSPCIDAGDPASELDPDCTRADMGSLPFSHANVVLRNGSGVNRVGFQSLTLPVVGSTWNVRVQSGGHPGATLAGFQVRAAALATPVALPAGEILIDPSSALLLKVFQTASGADDDFAVPIPADAALVGVGVYAQGLVVGGGAELLNALDVKLGH
jgi:hypothetical protein